ncbi:unnamed protein product, partial [Vitis vinifera]
MCEVCEQAPASVTCKADAAALCVTCDRDIHSANPLARRHDRVPVVPFYDSAESLVKSTAAAVGFLVPGGAGDEEDSEAASWLLPNPKLPEGPEVKSGEVFFSDIDPFLDFDYPDAKFPHHHHHHCGGNDGVVPVQAKDPSPPVTNHPADNCFELDFSRSKLSAYNYTAQSLSQSISSSDVGVVPDGNCNSIDPIIWNGSRSEGVEVQREEKEPEIRENHQIRLQKSLRRDASKNQRPFRKANRDGIGDG